MPWQDWHAAGHHHGADRRLSAGFRISTQTARPRHTPARPEKAAKEKNLRGGPETRVPDWVTSPASRSLALAAQERQGQTLYSVVGIWGSGFRPFHEFRDNSKNRQHQTDIRRPDPSNRQCGNPLRGPRNKQDQRDMKRCEDGHRAPEPPMPSQFPLYSNDETQHSDANQCWQRKIKPSRMIEEPDDRHACSHPGQHTPPGQAYFFGCFYVALYVVD